MRIVICGAGSAGRHVARVLSDVHEVTLIDRLHSRAALDVSGARFIAGDAADPAVLLRAGAQDADAVLAVTRDDPTNLTIALLAKHRFRVAWTVARVNDPAHAWLFTPPAGVDVVVSAAELIARLVQEEVTAGDLVTLLRLRDRHGIRGAFASANLVYGVFDLSMTPSQRNWGERNLVLSTPIMEWFGRQFIGDRDLEALRDPDISPLYADLSDMPPALFTVGDLDPLLDDSLFMEARWRAAGNEAELRVWPECVHGFTAFPLALAGSATESMYDFARERLGL